MATKDSGELQANSSYILGDYSFRIERSSGTSPNYDKIEAICTKDGKNARKSVQVPSSTQITGWYVEANEDTADVYIDTDTGVEPISTTLSDFANPVEPWSVHDIGSAVQQSGNTFVFNDTAHFHNVSISCVIHDEEPTFPVGSRFGIAVTVNEVNKRFRIYFRGELKSGSESDSNVAIVGVPSDWSVTGLTCYTTKPSSGIILCEAIEDCYGFNAHCATVDRTGAIDRFATGSVTFAYAEANTPGSKGSQNLLVGRFAISLEDAGGVGPGGGTGGGWTDPGDYDEDWEEGEPTHTLYVEVTGALSGRHNDPLEDPSYSYIPADKDTVKGYGCGGDGGHGGGGGAGASTVVIHKFATNQANSKEVTAIARRHGYGSGGGKGGKGGDGCILIYY